MVSNTGYDIFTHSRPPWRTPRAILPTFIGIIDAVQISQPVLEKCRLRQWRLQDDKEGS